MGLKPKLLLYFEIVLLVAVGTLLLLVHTQMRNQVVGDMQRELAAIATTASLQLDGDQLKSIRSNADVHSPAFAQLRGVLTRIRDNNGLIPEHIYTFYRDGGQVRFGLMTHPDPFVGDPYQLQPGMVDVFERGVVHVTDLYHDSNGGWISAYAPILDSHHAVIGLLEVDKSAEEYLASLHAVTRLNVTIGAVALAISSILGWLILGRIVIRPTRALSGGVRALARQDFRHRVRIDTRDEFAELGNALNHLSQQLNVARSVQQSFIPASLPNHSGYDFAVSSEACDTTAGDYVDAFELDKSRVAVLVADVTGHGLGPSLLMAACRSALRALSMMSLRPKDLIQQLDRLLQNDLREGRFITMIFGILESEGTFTFCNAGHGPALVLTKNGVAHLPSHRPPLGIEWDFADEEESETVMCLQPGDRILLASDGVSEACNAAGEQFGTDRMAAIVEDRTLDAMQVIQRHLDQLMQHCGGPRRDDDVTFLCIDRVPITSQASQPAARTDAATEVAPASN